MENSKSERGGTIRVLVLGDGPLPDFAVKMFNLEDTEPLTKEEKLELDYKLNYYRKHGEWPEAEVGENGLPF